MAKQAFKNCAHSFTLLIAVSSAALVACGPAANPRADMEARLSRGAVGKVFAERFPEDFQAAVETLLASEADRSLTRAQKDQIAYEASRGIRERHGHHAARAAPELLITVLQHQHDDMQLVLKEYGPEACRRYIMEGETTLPSLSNSVAASIDRIRELNILVMAEGRDNPVSRDEVSEADNELMLKALAERGLTPDRLEAGASSDEACPLVMGVTSTIISLPGPEGDRIRAALVQGIVLPQ